MTPGECGVAVFVEKEMFLAILQTSCCGDAEMLKRCFVDLCLSKSFCIVLVEDAKFARTTCCGEILKERSVTKLRCA